MGRAMDLRAGWVAGLLPLMAGQARADLQEMSVRCGPEVRRGTESAAGDEATAWSLGGGCTLGYGVSPAFTLLARYAYARSCELRVPGDDPQTSQVFTLTRHDLLAGVAWAPSDQLTPLLQLEGGAAAASQVDRQWRVRTGAGERQIAPALHDREAWRPLARLTLLGEWRFREFWSVSAGLWGEWAGTPGAGALLQLAAYRYL